MHSDKPSKGKASKARKSSEALRRFQRGELTEAEYLNRCIEVATAHVRGRVSREHYEMIRELLAELLDSDPVLVELKRRVLEKRP